MEYVGWGICEIERVASFFLQLLLLFDEFFRSVLAVGQGLRKENALIGCKVVGANIFYSRTAPVRPLVVADILVVVELGVEIFCDVEKAEDGIVCDDARYYSDRSPLEESSAISMSIRDG